MNIKNIKAIFTVFFIALSFIACERQSIEFVNKNGELESVIQQNSGVKLIGDQMTIQPHADPILVNQVIAITQLTGTPLNELKNLNPIEAEVVEKRVIRNSINLLKNKYGYTESELSNVFGSLTASEIGVFGLMLSAVAEVSMQDTIIIQGNPDCGTNSVIVNCLIESLSAPCTTIKTLKEIISNALDGKGTSVTRQQAAQIIREVIYAGVSGAAGNGKVVVAAIAFTQCLFVNGSALPEITDLPGSPGKNGFEVLENVPLGVSHNTKYFHKTVLENLTLTQFNNTPNMLTYSPKYNEAYLDPQFTQPLESGYYYHSQEIGNTGYSLFSIVEGGVVIGMVRKFLSDKVPLPSDNIPNSNSEGPRP